MKSYHLLLREGKLFPKGPKCYWPFRNEFQFSEQQTCICKYFFPLRLFALQGRHLSKVCSLGKSSEFCSLTFLIGKSFCLPFPWRKSGTNFCYCLRQFVITRQAACLRQEETLPQGPISGNFSPMIIGLNGSIFTPELEPFLIDGFERKQILINDQ